MKNYQLVVARMGWILLRCSAIAYMMMDIVVIGPLYLTQLWTEKNPNRYKGTFAIAAQEAAVDKKRY